MVLFNYSTKELTAKVVYYGPGLCGKTTNLQWVHEKLPIKNKGKMLSLATETDRTLFFDFLPIDLGTIRGMKTRVQLYTVPGQVFYNATRRMVLRGADAVVFVCDSQEPMLEANLESLENLRENLEINEIDPGDIPTVFQYNKRDLPNALPLEILNERLNPRAVPHFEAVAIQGRGVEETLKGVTGLVFRTLASKYGSAEDASGAARQRPRGAQRPAAGTPMGTVTQPPGAVAARPRTGPVAQPPVAAPASAATTTGHHDPLAGLSAGSAGSDPLDTLDLDAEEELDFEEVSETEDIEVAVEEELAPAPPGAPVPAAVAASANISPKATMISTAQQTEALRAKLMRPAPVEPELELEADEGTDALPLDLPEPRPAPALNPRPAAPVVVPAPASTPAATPQVVELAPVSVRVSADGVTGIAVPLLISLQGLEGTTSAVELRLTLQFKKGG